MICYHIVSGTNIRLQRLFTEFREQLDALNVR